jgi:hypothetical protein
LEVVNEYFESNSDIVFTSFTFFIDYSRKKFDYLLEGII